MTPVIQTQLSPFQVGIMTGVIDRSTKVLVEVYPVHRLVVYHVFQNDSTFNLLEHSECSRKALLFPLWTRKLQLSRVWGLFSK